MFYRGTGLKFGLFVWEEIQAEAVIVTKLQDLVVLSEILRMISEAGHCWIDCSDFYDWKGRRNCF